MEQKLNDKRNRTEKEYLETVVNEEWLVGEAEIEMLLGREKERGGRSGENGGVVGREEGVPESVGFGGGAEGGGNQGKPAGIARRGEGEDVGDAGFGKVGPREWQFLSHNWDLREEMNECVSE